MSNMWWIAIGILLTSYPVLISPARLSAQSQSIVRVSMDSTQLSLDSLIALALVRQPAIRAARARVDAARARVSVAGARPDPMLMIGVQNVPLGSAHNVASTSGMAMKVGGPDPMTMRMFGISQTIPYPGKLTGSRAAAEDEVRGADAALDAAIHQVVHDVQTAYAELVFVDAALEIVRRSYVVLTELTQEAEAHYAVGTGTQADALQAHVEETHLAESASLLTEQRNAVIAQLNAILLRSSETPIIAPRMPQRITRAAVAAVPDSIRFVSPALGARVAHSPFPSLVELQQMAVRNNPELREQTAMIDAQAARVSLARKAYLPDMNVSVQYGQRSGGLPDMVSASVSLPLPVSKRHKQDAEVADASARLMALQANREARISAMNAEIAHLVSELERERSQLALSVKALFPQGCAAIASALASYKTGKGDLRTVLDAQSAVFTYETEYARTLSDFAKNVATLEQRVGQEVLP